VRQQTVSRAVVRRRDPEEPDPGPEPAPAIPSTSAVGSLLARISEVLQGA
jgi:hypothetical protein